ncbi:hypothetical protein B0H14DRAFT_3898792 [Mycena olivaceomarginata]|nr:hypothetical protein B0H14DRAFT_3898792 [Mycena olivaceomarginata]
MSVPSMDSTYGAWLIALFLETILYGIGIVQTIFHFQWWPDDNWTIWGSVTAVMFFETTQILFFFRSTFHRFVQRFGQLQEELIWSDSLQLLANYITAFTVQLYFASRIYCLTRESRVYEGSALGTYIVVILAFVQVSAGIAQTILSYQIRSYLKLDQTKAITTLQTAASLACDVAITGYLCAFLHKNKQGLPRTQKVLNKLMMKRRESRHAHGHLVRMHHDLASRIPGYLLVLHIPRPQQQTFVFRFPLLIILHTVYMNSMLATLNLRQYMRNQILGNDWNTIDQPRQNPA